MRKKLYALTQVGRKEDRRQYRRREAYCPVVARLELRRLNQVFDAPCSLINISESGCLLYSNGFPWRDDDLGDQRDAETSFPRLSDHVRIFVPWIGVSMDGTIIQQGQYTLHVKFEELAASSVVNRIARIKRLRKS